MKHLILGSLLALTLSVGLFGPQAEASEFSLSMMPKASIALLGNTGPLGNWESDFLAWLRSTLREYVSNARDNYPTRSVPIPGTLLLFGGGFGGLMVWRARHPRS